MCLHAIAIGASVLGEVGVSTFNVPKEDHMTAQHALIEAPDTRHPTGDPARGFQASHDRLRAALRLANAIVEEEGREGHYVTDGEGVYWTSQRGHADSVGALIRGGRQLVVFDGAEVEHEPLVLACDHKLKEVAS